MLKAALVVQCSISDRSVNFILLKVDTADIVCLSSGYICYSIKNLSSLPLIYFPSTLKAYSTIAI